MVLALALIALLALPSEALGALNGNAFYGGSGAQGGQFISSGAIAVNQTGAGGASPGDLYVIDGARIQQLSPSGEFIRAFGLGVGGPGVNVCTEASSCVAGEASGQAGALSGPNAIAIDQATGTVYVGSLANHRIDTFSAAGEFEGAFGWAVKATGSAEELQFCTTATGCKAGSSGSGAGQFASAGEGKLSIALSPLNGHIVIGDPGSARIDEFAPSITAGKVTGVSFVRGYGLGAATGASEFQICTTVCHTPPLIVGSTKPGVFNHGYPNAVAVDSSGKVYAFDWYRGGEEPQPLEEKRPPQPRIQTFDPEGHFVGMFSTDKSLEFTNQLEIDPANGHLLASNGFRMFEFDAAGTSLGQIFNTGEKSSFIGSARNAGPGAIYITIQSPDKGVVELVEGEGTPPTVSIDPVSGITGTTAQFSGSVDPEGLFASYDFEYSSDGGLRWTQLPQGQLPSDSSPHPVSAKATGLEGLQSYQVRLSATKLFSSTPAFAETTFQTEEAPPIASKTSIAAISDSGARLEGTINPQNMTAAYRFECVSQAHFEAEGYAGATEVPPGGATIQAAGKAVAVSQQITGLAPATSYRCRLTASTPAGVDTGQEATFATFGVQQSGLPDGRVFEQATPIDKNGADALGREHLLRAAADGSAISYFITGGGGLQGGGGQDFPTYEATRGAVGWESHAFLPDSSAGERAQVSGWSEDLKRDYVLVWNSGTTATFYEQDLATGELTEIVSGLVPETGALYAAETPGGAQVLFESKSALAPEAIAGVWNLYVWDSGSGTLSLVSVLPDESTAPSGAFAGSYHWAELSTAAQKRGGANSDEFTQGLHVLSADGSKAFFTTSSVNQLYMREGIGTPNPTTSQVSASQKTNGSGPGGKDPKGPKKAAFMEATPDGRYVFFTSQEELTNDANTGTADQGNDLYRYDTETKELIDVSVDATGNGAEVQGVLGASADGSYVYFAANGALAKGAATGKCESSPVTGWGGANTGNCSIYLWHDGEVSFVSEISGEPGSGGLNWTPSRTPTLGTVNPDKTARVSEDGRALVFATTVSPTAYDSEGKDELYRYAVGGSLSCLSCSPNSAPPLGSMTLQDMTPGFTTPVNPAPFLRQNVSADGDRAFFETPDKLVASDVDGDNGCPVLRNGLIRSCQDVYEWETKGTGSCESEAQDGGCLFLISTGESNEPSYFAGASSNGEDAFFFTRQPLVRQDTDQLYDVYDARVGGGIASQNEAPPTPCEGETCKLGTAAAPGVQSAGSASFSGPGDPKPNRKKHHAKKHHKKHAKHNKRAKRHTKKQRTHR
jgi:hypothetical protein